MFKKNEIVDDKRERVVQTLHQFIVKDNKKESQAKADTIFIHALDISMKDTEFWRYLFAEVWALELPGVSNK
jgi:hypothetical protein